MYALHVIPQAKGVALTFLICTPRAWGRLTDLGHQEGPSGPNLAFLSHIPQPPPRIGFLLLLTCLACHRAFANAIPLLGSLFLWVYPPRSPGHGSPVPAPEGPFWVSPHGAPPFSTLSSITLIVSSSSVQQLCPPWETRQALQTQGLHRHLFLGRD